MLRSNIAFRDNNIELKEKDHVKDVYDMKRKFTFRDNAKEKYRI